MRLALRFGPRIGDLALAITVMLMLDGSALAAEAVATPTAAIPVRVTGMVHNPGRHELAPGSRLFDAAQAAGVRPDAFLTGAAWFHRPAEATQRGLKVGLIHELTVLVRHAHLVGHRDRAALGDRLRQRVEALPVTGRLTGNLDPVRLELELKHNRPIHAGDQLYYPSRPDTIAVLGAVAEDCTLPFVGLKPAADYAQECAPHGDADPDWIYVIQPDGAVSRHGNAAWNRTAPQPLAPGARILVPLRDVPGNATEALNADLAAFIATQPLPAEGSTR